MTILLPDDGTQGPSPPSVHGSTPAQEDTHVATVSVKHYQMFINGEHVDASEIDEIRSPATEEIVATIARGGVDHADAAVAAARDAFESGAWSRKSPEERSQIMRKIAERLGDEAEELVALE